MSDPREINAHGVQLVEADMYISTRTTVYHWNMDDDGCMPLAADGVTVPIMDKPDGSGFRAIASAERPVGESDVMEIARCVQLAANAQAAAVESVRLVLKSLREMSDEIRAQNAQHNKNAAT